MENKLLEIPKCPHCGRQLVYHTPGTREQPASSTSAGSAAAIRFNSFMAVLVRQRRKCDTIFSYYIRFFLFFPPLFCGIINFTKLLQGACHDRDRKAL